MENENLRFNRVFFENDTIRTAFFTRLKVIFGRWSVLRKKFELSKSRLESFRTGRISIPYHLFLSFLSFLTKEDNNFFIKNIVLKDPNWGQIKGGISTYKKHKEIFEKGRKIASSKTKYHFNLNRGLDSNLCELIGAFIGDGFTNKYSNAYMVQFTGDANLDKEYFLNKLKYTTILEREKKNP